MLRLIKILLGVCGVFVAALLALNAYISFKPAPKPTIDHPLATLLPNAPAGWTAKDMDIADSPEMKAQIDAILHFDDAADRVYTSNDGEVDVYAAYWQPGKFSPAKVGSHTPDTCWEHNGWTSMDKHAGVAHDFSGKMLKPYQDGTFEKDGQKINVMWWHLVGGESVYYDLEGWDNGIKGRIERLPAMKADFSKFGLDQRREQLMLRISTNKPFDELWNDPGFVRLMAQLSKTFDLYAEPAATAVPTGKA